MTLFATTARALLLLGAGTGAFAQAPEEGLAQGPLPSAFTARYAVIWKGMTAGASELELKRRPDGRYLYISRSNARGLFRLVFSEEILQTSTLEVTERGVRPLHYHGDDGSQSTERDIRLDFDWRTGQVTGIAENQPVTLELPPSAHDPMSIQLALIHDLRAGRKPTAYRMVDKTQMKTYDYTHEGTAALDTALGRLDTVVYSSHRADSSRRITRTWYAASLGYIPVKAERLREGKREWLMEIRSLEQP